MQLAEFWSPQDVSAYKVHFARFNQEEQPLHVLARSMNDWAEWQRWYPSKNDFNRPYIFSVAQIPEQPDVWMFGGIWSVNGTTIKEDGRPEYVVRLTKELGSLVGRLKLHRVHKGRGTRLKLENHYKDFLLYEILPERYSGLPFPGFDKVHLGFQELEALIVNGREDWSAALSHSKGIYLITDSCTQRRYVGSAYGDFGIWARWQTYANLGHGGNLGMKELLQGHDLEYCRRNFQFALLERHDARVDDKTILDREAYWKRVLDTRHAETGLNKN